jgi:hypothetical protein
MIMQPSMLSNKFNADEIIGLLDGRGRLRDSTFKLIQSNFLFNLKACSCTFESDRC